MIAPVTAREGPGLDSELPPLEGSELTMAELVAVDIDFDSVGSAPVIVIEGSPPR